MKARIVSRSLCVVAVFLLAWAAGAKSVIETEDPAATAPEVQLEVALNPQTLVSLATPGATCASLPEGEEKKVDLGLFESLSLLLGDGEKDQMAFQCPGIFYQPTTCSGCINPLNQCLNEGLLPPFLCSACFEVCQCNRGCCL